MRGPATLTDELTQAGSTDLVRRDGYTVARTSACSRYHCGNCLVLDEEPEELFPWVERFRAELPGVGQLHLQWETAEVTEANDSVTCLGDAAPLARVADVDVRPLEPADWSQQLALAIEIVEESYPGSQEYTAWRCGQHHEAAEAGLARWWGAFEGARLIGSAGLYESDRWARFQSVMTAPAARGRGVCTTLVQVMCAEVSSRRPGEEVILVVARGSHAERIYSRLGFEPIGTQVEVSRPL